MAIIEAKSPMLYVRIGEVKPRPIMRETRSPDTSGAWRSPQIELGSTGEAVREDVPMNQIAAVTDPDAGKPLESRISNVVVLADTENRRIRVKARKDGIANESGVVDGHRSHTAPLALTAGVCGKTCRTCVDMKI